MTDGSGYEYGRGAEMRVARAYLGVTRDEMAGLLGIRPQSYQGMENGKAAIHVGIWDKIARLYEHFEDQVTGLIEEAGDEDTPFRVRVWRGRSDDETQPNLWLRIVSEAHRRNPLITPVYPDDDK